MTGDGASSGNGTRGFALIVVVWFLVLIGAIGTYLIVNGRAQSAIAHNIRAAADAESLADAGLARIVFNQTDPVMSNRWRLDGLDHRFVLPGGDISIRLQDEAQKINPNLASDALLAGLFEACGSDRATARHLGAAVADWVSPDGPPRPMGAKREQYQAAGRRYGPPNVPLESLDDLGLVLGMTPAILASVRPYLTIHSQTAEPSLGGAPAPVRRAVILAAHVSDEDEDGAQAGDKPQQASHDEERLIAAQITARSRDGGVFVRYAVLRLEPDNPKAYALLDWARGTLDESGENRTRDSD